MYKLLIAEDEELIRKGIINSVKWHELGFEIIGQVANGREALEIVEQNRPDVILTDVRMPVMDGLEMSALVNQKYPDIKIIILSGFADFEYAQDAIRFKAFDYLLKPTDKNKFLQCFIRLKDELDQLREAAGSLPRKQASINKNFIQLKDAFLLDLLEGNAPVGVALEDMLYNLEIDLSEQDFAAVVILIEPKDQSAAKILMDSQSLIKETCQNVLDEILHSGLCVIKKTWEIILILNFKEHPFSETAAIRTLDQALFSLRNAFTELNLNFIAGLGLTYPDLYHLPNSYQQARKCIDLRFYDQAAKYFVYSENEQYFSGSEQQRLTILPKESPQIVELVMNGQPQPILNLLDEVFSRFEAKKATQEIVKEYSHFLCTLFLTSMSSLENFNQSLASQIDFKSEIERCSTIEELKKFVSQYLLAANRIIKETAVDSNGPVLVDKIKKFILSNYAEDISLEKLSQMYFISPSYLSYLFKSLSGDSYSDFLRMTRLNNAKYLLESQPDLKVYEICYLVGYKEYKYFSIQFKNTFGISPTEIRKAKRGGL